MSTNTGAPQSLKALMICGSLRKESFNRKLMNAAIKYRPQGVETVESVSVGDIPHLNDDIAKVRLPDPVQRLNQQIEAADAVVIITPEYNYGIPGVLKNTLDWVTCPHPPQNKLRYKPVAMMGASIGNFGTVRCQNALRQTMLFIEAYVMPKPEVYVFRAQDRFAADGELTDQATIAMLREFWDGLARYTAMVKAAGLTVPAH
jgi:chromate reductase, NAD(P)H dehydrogenase (quinone)